jgi:hypothetical protein
MYHLVEFNDKSVEVINELWIEERLPVTTTDADEYNLVISFPPKSEYQRIRLLLKEMKPPSSTWQSFHVKLLYSNCKQLKIYLLSILNLFLVIVTFVKPKQVFLYRK